jgi:hypothetical protein
MARAGKWGRVFVDGYALTVDVSDVTISNTNDELESSGYGMDKRYLVGQGDASITVDGYYTTATAAALQAGNGKIISVAIGDNAAPTVGAPTFSISACQTEATVKPPKDGLVAINAKFLPDATVANIAGLDIGVMLCDTTDTSADGNGTALDQAAQSTAGGVGICHITGVSASDTVVVNIQDSANGTDWADLITFTIDGSVAAAQRLEVTGTVDRYVRAEWDVTGSGVAIDIFVAFKRL